MVSSKSRAPDLILFAYVVASAFDVKLSDVKLIVPFVTALSIVSVKKASVLSPKYAYMLDAPVVFSSIKIFYSSLKSISIPN
ncbi:MAG: hypothetical protein MJ149_01235, partial [Clostridia bacterium]|nr:hypothetical protein [Clostridia bacterium]